MPQAPIFTCSFHTSLFSVRNALHSSFHLIVSHHRPSDIKRFPSISVLHSTSHHSQSVICPLIYTLYPPLNFAFHERKVQYSHQYNAKVLGKQKVVNEELLNEGIHIISLIEKPTYKVWQREQRAHIWGFGF